MFVVYNLGSVAEWVLAIAEVAIAIGTFAYALPAIAHGIETLEQMRTEANLTLHLFELQNRPYLSILPKIDYDIRESYDFRNPEVIDFFSNPTKSRSENLPHPPKIEVIDIDFKIKNHGNLPAIIQDVRISEGLERVVSSDRPQASFPQSEATYRVSGIPRKKIKGAARKLSDWSVTIDIIYCQNNWEERYTYSLVGVIKFNEDRVEYVAEFFELNQEWLDEHNRRDLQRDL